MPVGKDTVKASVYFPRDLYARVVAAAKQDGRPLSQYVVQVLRQELARSKGKHP